MWETRQWGFPGSRRTGAPLAPSLRASGRASVLPGALSPQQGPVVGVGVPSALPVTAASGAHRLLLLFRFPWGCVESGHQLGRSDLGTVL